MPNLPRYEQQNLLWDIETYCAYMHKLNELNVEPVGFFIGSTYQYIFPRIRARIPATSGQ